MALLSILVLIAGILMSIGHFPQAYKIYKNKSSKDVSLITCSIFFLGNIVWLIYGISLHELPIIISFSIGILGSLSVVLMWFTYRARKRKN
jgi:MtN3 and saliva related transmembrane protein